MHRSKASVAVLLPSALLLSACSSSPHTIAAGGPSATVPQSAPSATRSSAPPAGNAQLSSTQLQTAINGALSSVTALLVKGTMTVGGTDLTADVQFNKNSAAGAIAENGTNIPLIAVNGTVYIKVTSALLARSGGSVPSAVKKLLVNKWLSSATHAGADLTKDVGPFSDLGSFTQQLAQNNGEVYTADGTTTLKGVAVAKYKDVSPTDGTSEFYVPVAGPTLPIEQVGTGKNKGSFAFVWNKPAKVSPPPSSEIYSGPDF